MKSEWIESSNCEPLEDGTYLVQTIYGDLKGCDYTLKGGWNTMYLTTGELHTESAINDGYVARWLSVDKPPKVPEEWEEAYLESWRKENA